MMQHLTNLQISRVIRNEVIIMTLEIETFNAIIAILAVLAGIVLYKIATTASERDRY